MEKQMMKCVKIVPAMALLSLMFVVGCFVQSLYPFYTDKTKIAIPPHIAGHWEPIEGEEEGGRPWIFSEETITSYHKKVELKQAAVFFKVDDVLFLDVQAGSSIFAEENIWQNAHRLSVHQVYKVETNRNEMTLFPLDFDWVKRELQSGAVKLSYYRPVSEQKNTKDDEDAVPIVLTENSEKLTEFLKYCIANPDAFRGEAIRYVFRKVPDPATKN